MSGESHLGESPKLEEQREILRVCCDYETTTGQDWVCILPDYVTYYEEQRNQVKLQHGPKGTKLWTFPIWSHMQLVGVVKLLQDHGKSLTRAAMRDKIRNACCLGSLSDGGLDDVIDLALRVWLMINFRSQRHIGVGRGRPCVEWAATKTLAEELSSLFRKSRTELTIAQRRLSRHFTAANLMYVCGLKIEWTTSLEDHLRMDRQHKTVWIFAHRQFLIIKADSNASLRYGKWLPSMLEN